MNTVVANASSLIALARIDHFSLLQQLFQQVWVPPSVWEEVVVQGAGKPAATACLQAEQEGWLGRRSAHDTLAVKVLLATLGPGESEAIILAREMNCQWVLLDDDLARVHASRLGLKVKGTVGLLLTAHRAGLLTDLQAALDKLRTRGFWLSDRIYHAVLAQVAPSNP